MEEAEQVICDTDVLIEYLDRANIDVAKRLLQIGIRNLFISSVTASELVVGAQDKDHFERLIKFISKQLEPEFGNGFSVRQLELMRQFYRAFPIANSLRSQLSWTHYRTLIRVDDEHKREYYLAETAKNNWSVRQMERQCSTHRRLRVERARQAASSRRKA